LFKLIGREGGKGMVLFRVCPHISEAERLKWQEIAKGLENILGRKLILGFIKAFRKRKLG
jgi:hypothetical protein